MMIIEHHTVEIGTCVLKNEMYDMTLSYEYLPVTLTERECSQSICKIKLLTRALRALGNPVLTSIILYFN